MANLHHSTLAADSVVDTCTCERSCGRELCSHAGRWHNHADDVCSVHPDTIVDVPTPRIET